MRHQLFCLELQFTPQGVLLHALKGNLHVCDDKHPHSPLKACNTITAVRLSRTYPLVLWWDVPLSLHLTLMLIARSHRPCFGRPFLHPQHLYPCEVLILVLHTQTDDLMPSGSDFVTSGDESGGAKARRRHSSKDRPKKSKLNRQSGEANGDLETGTEYCLCVYMYM